MLIMSLFNWIASDVRKLQNWFSSLHRQGTFFVSHELVSKGELYEHLEKDFISISCLPQLLLIILF